MTGASNNAQGRLHRAANFGRINNDPIDKSLYETDSKRKELGDRRNELISKKKAIEASILAINQKISAAITKGNYSGKYMPNAQWSRLQDLLAKEKSRVGKVDVDLAKITQEWRSLNRKFDAVHFNTFPKVFVRTAKELLPGEVFDRIFIATVHRCESEGA